MRAQSMRVGMRGDEGRIADSGDVPEPRFVEVRQVDQDPQPVAGADQLLAEVGQTGSCVGRSGTAERHAVPERIRSAPNRAERAKSRLMQYVQQFEVRVDRFRAFDMKNRRQHAVLQASLDVIDVRQTRTRPCDSRSIRRRRDTMREDSTLRRRQFNRRRDEAAPPDVLRRCIAIGADCPITRGDEDREQPAGESPLRAMGRSKLALGLSFEERPRRVRAAAPVETQQDVIVAVEDRHAPRRLHQRCSVAKIFKVRPLPDRRLGVPFGEHSVWQSTHPLRIAEARSTMKAAFIEQYGGPEVLKYGDLPDPVAGPGEVVIDMVAASVNGADWKVRVGALQTIEVSLRPGS